MQKDVDLPKAIAVLPPLQQMWLDSFVRHDVTKAPLADPDLKPGSAPRGYYGRTLAGAMMASEAMRKRDKDAAAQAEVLLMCGGTKAASPAIETGLVEINAFKAAFDAARNADLGDVAYAVDYTVMRAISDNNFNVRRAKDEAGPRPKPDIALVMELTEMPPDKIVLLTEVEAVERAAMAMSYAAALYAMYYGVLAHLAENKFKEWARYAEVARMFWGLFRKGYVVMGTALPENGEGDKGGMGTPYVCAKLRATDRVEGGRTLVEIRG